MTDEFIYRASCFVYGWCACTLFAQIVYHRALKKMFAAGLRLGHERGRRGEPADTPLGPRPGQRTK